MSDDWFRLNKAQRIQMKKFTCLLGILLIVFLLLWKVLASLGRDDRGEKDPVREPDHVPVLQILSNVWVMEEDEEGILIFREGNRERYAWGTVDARAADDGGAGTTNGGQQTDGGSTTNRPGQQAEGGAGTTYRPEQSVREQVADVILSDGRVISAVPKTEKINGRILAADKDWIEVEGYGRLTLAEDYKGYRLFDSLATCTVRDLFFGYSDTDLCLEDGKVCAVLMVKEEAMKYIRVLIKASDYKGSFHESPVVTADTGFAVTYYGAAGERLTESFQAGEEIEFGSDSPYLAGGRVSVRPDVLTGKVILKNVKRSQGTPAYRGCIELLKAEEGIVVINEVLLEEYLYSVVPSEMPSRYPSEALKAQAICARTYAYGHMERAGFPQYGAHVDDSTTYQVYNNIREQESTTTAVKETFGQLLYTGEGTLAGTYYYSTSCGVGSNANVWKTESAASITYLTARSINKSAAEESLGEKLRDEDAFYDFITSRDENDFEAGEAWYRWTYEVKDIDEDVILERLKTRYKANSKQILTLEDGEYVSKPVESLGELRNLEVVSRGAGGTADEMVVEGTKNTYKVITGHNIRCVLNNGESKVVRQDGSKVSSPSLLPSSFLVIEVDKKGDSVTKYKLVGGGFGHGVGMSQNGAKEMAKCGYTAWDILTFFYQDCVLKQVYDS